MTLPPPTGLLKSVTSLCFERLSLQVVSGDELRHTHPPSYSGGLSFEVFTTDIALKTLCTHLTADSLSLTVNKSPQGTNISRKLWDFTQNSQMFSAFCSFVN